MDHFKIMDGDSLSVHFRAHIVFKLSSLPSCIYLYIIVSPARPDILSLIHHRNKQIFSMWSGHCCQGADHTFSLFCVLKLVVVVGLDVRCEKGDDVQTWWGRLSVWVWVRWRNRWGPQPQTWKSLCNLPQESDVLILHEFLSNFARKQNQTRYNWLGTLHESWWA